MLKKVWKNLSLVSTPKRVVHRLYWLDKEKQIYDETSFKHLELRILGIRVWHTSIDVDTKHQIMDNKGKTIGFVSNDIKEGEQTGSNNKGVSEKV